MDIGFSEAIEEELDSYVLEHVRSEMLEEIMAAANVVVEPGDMVLFHTGFATELMKWDRNPDPVMIHAMCT